MARHLSIFAVVLLVGAAAAAERKGEMVKVDVDGRTRKALIFPAADKTKKAPLVFAFHGHGGTAEKAAEKFDYQTLWPQAVVVYMQGQPIASPTDPDGEKDGWQHKVGEKTGKLVDRDLDFFDATLAQVRKEYKIDDTRVYATGHSNGGGFTYLLWAARGDTFAAVAPSSASSALHYLKALTPKPALHVAGKTDDKVPYDSQRELMDALRKLNGCEGKGEKWNKLGKLYPSAGGTPVVELIHPDGHDFWDEAPALIVTFFKEHKKEAKK